MDGIKFLRNILDKGINNMDGIKFLRNILDKGINIPLIMFTTVRTCDKCPLSKRNTCSKYKQASIYCNQGQWKFCGIYKFYVKERVEMEKIEFPPVNQSGLIQV
jgi:hypothetical protein